MDGIFNELRYEPEREARERSSADNQTPLASDRLRDTEAEDGGEQGGSEEVAASGISEADAEEAIIRFRAVQDPLKVAELEAKPNPKVNRSMQEIDGILYPAN